MGLGKQIRNAFLHAVKLTGQTIVVRSPIEDGCEQVFETVGTTGKEFHFPELVDVRVGSILQIKGSRDYYKVIDTHDNLEGGEFIFLAAVVEKVDSAGIPTATEKHGATIFNAPVHGGVQIGGRGNVQTNNVAVGESLDSVVAQLVHVLSTSNLTDLQKDDAIEAAQRLTALAKAERTPDVVQRVNDRLKLIKTTLEISSDLAKIGMPLLSALASHLQ